MFDNYSIKQLLGKSNPLFNKFIINHLARDSKLKSMKKIIASIINYYYKCFKSEGVVFSSYPAPLELLYSFDLIPFIPEAFTGLIVSQGRERNLVRSSEESGAPRDACSFQKSTLGLINNDELPKCRGLIYSSATSCDSPKKIFEILSKTLKVPGFFLDVPYSKKTEANDYLESEFNDLISFLEKLTGISFDAQKLNKNIELINHAGSLLNDLINIRKNTLVPIDFTEMYSVYSSAISFNNNIEEVIKCFNSLLIELRQRIKEGAGFSENSKRIMWLNLPIYHDLDLINYLQSNNCAVVWDEFPMLSPPLRVCKGIKGLVKRYSSSIYNQPVNERIKLLLETAKNFNVDAVIHHSHNGCRQSCAAAGLIKNAFKNEGIPFLVFEGDCIDRDNKQSGQIKTRVQSFLEMIK